MSISEPVIPLRLIKVVLCLQDPIHQLLPDSLERLPIQPVRQRPENRLIWHIIFDSFPILFVAFFCASCAAWGRQWVQHSLFIWLAALLWQRTLAVPPPLYCSSEAQQF